MVDVRGTFHSSLYHVYLGRGPEILLLPLPVIHPTVTEDQTDPEKTPFRVLSPSGSQDPFGSTDQGDIFSVGLDGTLSSRSGR